MNALLGERLERKTEDIFKRLKQTKYDWNKVFYLTLTRNFDFETNSDAFEWLAVSLPFKYIRKHRNNSMQVEALLFGQAGLLTAEKDNTYYKTLQLKYKFLQDYSDRKSVV